MKTIRLALAICAATGAVYAVMLVFSINGLERTIAVDYAHPAPAPFQTWLTEEPDALSLSDATPIHYVAIAGADSGDCSSPGTACRTIQYAVDQTGEGDEVRVAAGTYTDVHARPRDDVSNTGFVTQVVYVTKSLAIKGGYSATDWMVRDPPANPTTLDAGGQGRVLYAVGEGNSVIIEGLQLTGGDASGLAGDHVGRDAGGGAYIYSATAVINGVEAFGNAAEYFGGGLYSSYNTVTVTDSAIFSNAAQYGGGLYLRYGHARLNNNRVYSNTAGWGGGIYCQYCDNTVLSHNTIADNTAEHFGGGLTLYTSQAALNDNNIAANSGIGLYMYDSEATLNREILSKNSAYGLEIRWGSVVTAVNTLVVDNPDSGLLLRGATLHLAHATVARNGANGLYLVKDGLFANAILTNTILVSHNVGIEVTAGNTVTLEATLWGTDTWANDTDWTGAGTVITGVINIWDNPGFLDPNKGDYHIGSNSAAIDVGVDAGVAADMDGQPRPCGKGFDIGADEYGLYLYLPFVLRGH